MRRIKTMLRVLRETGAGALIGSYVFFAFICALVIWVAEKDITSF